MTDAPIGTGNEIAVDPASPDVTVTDAHAAETVHGSTDTLLASAATDEIGRAHV